MWNIKYVSTWVRSMNALSALRCLVRNSTQWPSRAGTAYFFAVYRVVITVSGPMWTSSEYRNLKRGKQNNVKTQVHMLLSAEWIRKVWQLYLTQKHLSKKGIYSAECLFIFFWDSLSKIAFESWDQTSRQIYCLVLFFPYHTTPELYHKSADFSLYFFGIYFAISANVISLSKEFI